MADDAGALKDCRCRQCLLVWVNGQIDGELHCTYLVIDKGAHISGTVSAELVIIDGKVSKLQFREKGLF
jgi:hypothetical protein